jgi:hypothetical protein
MMNFYQGGDPMKKIDLVKKMVSTKEVAEIYPVCTGTLQNWRVMKQGPRFFRVGRKVLYRLDDLENFFTTTPVLTNDSLSQNR